MSSGISGIGSSPQVISGASKTAPRQTQGEVNISNEGGSSGVNPSESLSSILKSLNEALSHKSSSDQRNGTKVDQYV